MADRRAQRERTPAAKGLVEEVHGLRLDQGAPVGYVLDGWGGPRAGVIRGGSAGSPMYVVENQRHRGGFGGQATISMSGPPVGAYQRTKDLNRRARGILPTGSAPGRGNGW